MQTPAPEGAHWALADLLATLAEDASAAAAASMSDVAVEYLERASDGEGPVSRQASAASIAGRFDEPMPAHGRPMVDVIQRLRDDVLRDANRLSHPMYLGHQVS